MKNLLDYSPHSKPLYAQVYDILVKKLHKGEYSQHSVFPTEAEFQDMFGISRITARRALAELAKEGYVQRRPGIGTQVISNSKKPSAIITNRIINVDDNKINRKTLSIEQVKPTQEIKHALNIDDDQYVTKVTRIICCKDLPIQWNTFYFPAFLGIIEEAMIKDSIYLYLEKNDHNIDRYVELINAELLNEQEKNALNANDITPVLVKKRTGYTAQNKAVFYAILKYINHYIEYRIESS